jgi:SNF2 family DNA or RNA helicase
MLLLRRALTSATASSLTCASVRRSSQFQSIYRELNYFDEDFTAVQPADLNIELLPFQQRGVGWMLRREKISPGGIMADHLGMGKTVQMISLCVESARYKKQHKKETVAPSRAEKQAAGFRVVTLARQLQKVPAVGNCSRITQPGKDLHRIILECNAAIERGELDFQNATRDLTPWLEFTKRYHPSFAHRAYEFLNDEYARSFDDIDTDEMRTLIVVPAALLYQWNSEIRSKVKSSRGVNVHIMHGGESRNFTKAQLEGFDFVITTYDIVVRLGLPSLKARVGDATSGSRVEWNKDNTHPLFQVRWKRIILDEAHVIRNEHSSRSQVISRLEGIKRWVVTATPFHNSIRDLQPLMKFIGTSGLPVPNSGDATAMILRDRTLQRGIARAMMPVMLRRAPVRQVGNTTEVLVQLPPKHDTVVYCELEPHEAVMYNEILVRAKSQVAAGGSAVHTFAMMTRLRQICTHPWLLTDKLMDSYMCNICKQQASVPVLSKCGHAFCMECLSNRFNERSVEQLAVRLPCPVCDQPINSNILKSKTSSSHNIAAFRSKPFESSTKLDAVIGHIMRVIRDSPQDKIVLFSQFTTTLDLLSVVLERAKIAVVRLDGTMPLTVRTATIARFTNENVRLLLASKMAVGVGLNLTAGNHVIVVDPWWNPAVEEQAVHRCHRIGQRKAVHITRFVTRNTIEQYCFDIAERKRKIGEAVLTAATDEDAEVDFSADLMSAVTKIDLVPIKRTATAASANETVSR